MLIKMLGTVSGPNLSAQPGQQIDVDQDTADQMIAGGFAVPVRTISIETTELPVIENAVIQHGKPKGKK